MSITHPAPDWTPSGALAGAVAAMRELTGLLWSARSDEELVGVIEQVAVLKSVPCAVEAGAVVEADLRGVAKTRLCFGSTGDWLTHLGGLHRGGGQRIVRRAHGLTGDRSRTGAALADGAVSPAQASIVVDAVATLPSGDLVRARGERCLLDQARSLNASDLARAGRHLAEVVDPDRAEGRLEAALDREERAAHAGRFLWIGEDRAGGVRVKGYGSAEDGALLKAALMPLTCPSPAVEDETAEPQVQGKVHDPRDHGARLWDALVATAQHGLDTDLPPEAHGARPRLVITIDHVGLKAGLAGSGIGTTADGTELSPTVARRLACDADLIPAVLGTHAEVLDVGRTRRLVTAAIWTALVVRDQHCTFPACTRPPVMCHAHHLRHWADGGTTTLDNLALLCGHHHRAIHHTPWEIRLNATDRKPEFRPPPKAGISPAIVRRRARLE